ncbi:TIGR04282 family arsenosugar biosynthesis glycosyltransferase [Leptospira sp. WS92.C1]
MNLQNNLILFLRNPVTGWVKTRLAKSLGDQTALAIYEQLLAITQKQIQALDIPIRLYFDSIPKWDFSLWGKATSAHLQTGNDLGEKMENAFLETFSAGAKKAVIIGSDCPDLETKHIREAFFAMDHRDTVIGPAKDGGYYLLGLKSMSSEIFHEISWSTNRVFATTLEKLQLLRKNIWILPILNDIDEPEDLEPYLRSGKLSIDSSFKK